MEKIDKRITYICVLDTETCNGIMGEDGRLDLSSSLVYDLGYVITDKRGKVYRKRSLVIDDVFYGMSDVMKSAYYKKKLPRYYDEIARGEREVVTLAQAKALISADLAEYGCKIVSAHNAYFDYNSTNTTQRYITKSKFRYFLPYGVEWWDSLKMARDVIGNKPSYKHFCERNGYMTKHKVPRCKLTAEILYRYISGNTEFIESHTGLEDVMIEKEIVAYCFRQHKKMRKELFNRAVA